MRLIKFAWIVVWALAVTMGLMYLILAIAQGEFNSAHWGQGAKTGYGLMGVVFLSAGAVCWGFVLAFGDDRR